MNVKIYSKAPIPIPFSSREQQSTNPNNNLQGETWTDITDVLSGSDEYDSLRIQTEGLSSNSLDEEFQISSARDSNQTKTTLFNESSSPSLSSSSSIKEKLDYTKNQTTKWQNFSSQFEFLTIIDYRFVKSIFNIIPFFYPFTFRKLFFYLLYAFVFAMMSGIKNIYPNIWEFACKIWSINIIAVLIGYLLIDPLLILICVFLCKYPEIPSLQTSTFENNSIALVITCHNSADVILQTLKASLVHLKAENIYVCDNGNNHSPTDNTRVLVRGLDESINYRFTSVGNKTIAQFLAVRDIKLNRPDITEIMIIDDDVTISPTLRFPVNRLNEVTKCIVFGINGTDNSGTQDKIWTKWQDLEYKLSDFIKIFQDRFSSVLFPHGAISLWDKDILYQILSDHDAIFFADDVKMGMWMTRRGYRACYYADSVVNTETPETLFGPSPNYYNQRVRSWDFAEHMITWRLVKCFLFGYIKNDIIGTLIMKIFQLYGIYSTLNDYLRVPGIVFYISRAPDFFNITFWTMILFNTTVILLWNYISCRNRPDLQTTFLTIVTLPVYKLISQVIRIISLLRCYLCYWPRWEVRVCRPKLMDDEKIKEIDSFQQMVMV